MSRRSTPRVPWSDNEDATLRRLYPDVLTADLARQLGRSLTSTYQRARRLGLEKSDAFRASTLAAYRFKKGHAPANKGVKRPAGWAPGRMRETQFTKGERRGVALRLWKPVGSERLSREGYLERKINDGLPPHRRWRAVHLVRWEELHGPIPKGMTLKNLDGDRLNTDPTNYELVPRALLPRLNGKSGRNFDRAPQELKPTIMAIAKLEHAARTRDDSRSANV